jgi:hypothetical protein
MRLFCEDFIISSGRQALSKKGQLSSIGKIHSVLILLPTCDKYMQYASVNSFNTLCEHKVKHNPSKP